jgi:hypothetical protein
MDHRLRTALLFVHFVVKNCGLRGQDKREVDSYQFTVCRVANSSLTVDCGLLLLLVLPSCSGNTAIAQISAAPRGPEAAIQIFVSVPGGAIAG